VRCYWQTGADWNDTLRDPTTDPDSQYDGYEGTLLLLNDVAPLWSPTGFMTLLENPLLENLLISVRPGSCPVLKCSDLVMLPQIGTTRTGAGRTPTGLGSKPGKAEWEVSLSMVSAGR
jgi:hypothetical protein